MQPTGTRPAYATGRGTPRILTTVLAALLAVTLTACGDDPYEQFGEGWDREGTREVLSFFVATAAHGDPPGWAEWEAGHEPSGPDLWGRRFQPYLAEAKLSDADSAASDFWEKVLRVTDRQRTAVRADGQDAAAEDSSVAAHFGAWFSDHEERLATTAPQDVLPLYVDALEAADDSTSRGHLADLEDLLRDADRIGAPVPDPSWTFAPDAPPADVTRD